MERALGGALREVTLKYDDIEREKNGGADLSNSYDMAAHELCSRTPRRRAARSPLSTPPGTSPRITTRWMLSPRRFRGGVGSRPEEVPSDKVKNPMAAFQAAFQAQACASRSRPSARRVIAKAKEEVRLLRRRFLMAPGLSKPKEVKPKGALIQAAFLEARDAAAKGAPSSPPSLASVFSPRWIRTTSPSSASRTRRCTSSSRTRA